MTFSHGEPPWQRFEIACVNKPDRQSLVEHITHVGGYGAGEWKLPVEEIIRRIEGRIEGFYVRVGVNEVDVFVVSPYRTKETHPDNSGFNEIR